MAKPHVVAEYERNLKRVAARLATQIDPDNGFGLTATQGSSLVNTAEALIVLRAAADRSLPIDEAIVKRALSYVSNNLKKHCEPRAAASLGRGAKTRFVSFSLMGLAAWPGMLDSAAMRTIHWGITWLRDASFPDGLPEEHGVRDLSLFQNALAISALSRILRLPGLEQSRSRAIDVMGRAIHGSLESALPNCTWPWQTYGTRTSPAITALHLIALHDADVVDLLPQQVTFGSLESHSRLASDQFLRSGALWLSLNSSKWRGRIEMDPNVTGTQWHHLSYGLCAEALAIAGDPLGASAVEGWRDLLDLWDRSRTGWTEPTIPKVATIRADYVAVRAFEAFLANFGTRGAEELGAKLREGPDVDAGSFAVLWRGRLAQFALECEAGSEPIGLKLSPSLETLLAKVADIGGDTEYVSRDALANALNYSPGSIGTYVGRLNAAVVQQTSRPHRLLTRSRGSAKGSGYRLNVRALRETDLL